MTKIPNTKERHIANQQVEAGPKKVTNSSTQITNETELAGSRVKHMKNFPKQRISQKLSAIKMSF